MSELTTRRKKYLMLPMLSSDTFLAFVLGMVCVECNPQDAKLCAQFDVKSLRALYTILVLCSLNLVDNVCVDDHTKSLSECFIKEDTNLTRTL